MSTSRFIIPQPCATDLRSGMDRTDFPPAVSPVEHILPVHEAQTPMYLRLSGCKVGLLMNFNSVVLKDGLRRFNP
jgi:hypothetical protein